MVRDVMYWKPVFEFEDAWDEEPFVRIRFDPCGDALCLYSDGREDLSSSRYRLIKGEFIKRDDVPEADMPA